MGRILGFGESGTSKYFDLTQSHIYQQNVRDNFGNLMRASKRMLMMSGGFDGWGISKTPNEVGSVQLDLKMKSMTRNGMQTYRDALRVMERYGLTKLYYQEKDSTQRERFCYARVTDVQMTQDIENHSDLHQKVQISWEVPYPVWHQDNQAGPLWGFEWGASWGDAPSIAASGVQTDNVLSTIGNADSLLRYITVSCGTGQTCQNPTIQRLVDGVVKDEVSFTDTLVATDSLVFSPWERTVKKNGTLNFANFDYEHPRWFVLEPGDNDIRVVFANSGDAATVTLQYYDNYAGI